MAAIRAITQEACHAVEVLNEAFARYTVQIRPTTSFYIRVAKCDSAKRTTMQTIPKKLPRILAYTQNCPHIDQFALEYAELDQASYDKDRKLSICADGTPLYASRTPKMPTNCGTPGHTLPSGYTPSGKYKPAKYVPYKSDKRAGK